MLDKLKDLDLRYEDLESQLGDPRVYGDAEKLRQVNRELKELLPGGGTYRALYIRGWSPTGLIRRRTAAAGRRRSCSMTRK